MNKTQNRKAAAAARRRQGRGRLIIAALAVTALATGGLYWLTAGAGQRAALPPAAETRGSLEAPGAFHDFGRVSMRNGKVTHTYEVFNRSAEPALIRRFYTSCMCTEATLVDGQGSFGPFGMEGMGYIPDVNQVVAPGEKVTVVASFDPNAHGPAGIGRNDRTVALLMGNGRRLDLQFTAWVTP